MNESGCTQHLFSVQCHGYASVQLLSDFSESIYHCNMLKPETARILCHVLADQNEIATAAKVIKNIFTLSYNYFLMQFTSDNVICFQCVLRGNYRMIELISLIG